MQKNILIISAHADDHITCAGTIFKLREKGFEPFEVVLTDSSLGQDFRIKEQQSKKQVAKVRAVELSKASQFLGIKKTFSLGQPDLGLIYNQALMFEVVKIIRKIKPKIVFLHNEYDMHPDHKEAFKIGITAIKIASTGVLKETLGKEYRVPLILCCEGMIPSKTQISVDITRFANKKNKLFIMYESQANSKIVNFEKGLGAVRGYQLRNGGLQAEAFTLQDEFPVLFFEEE